MVILEADLGLAKNALPPTAPLAAAGARAATPMRATVALPAPETERLANDMVREEAIFYGVRGSVPEENDVCRPALALIKR